MAAFHSTASSSEGDDKRATKTEAKTLDEQLPAAESVAAATEESRSPSPLLNRTGSKRRRVVIDSDDEEPHEAQPAPAVPPNTPVVQHKQVAYLITLAVLSNFCAL